MKLALATVAVFMGHSIQVAAQSRQMFKSKLDTAIVQNVGIFQELYEESTSSIRVPESRRAEQTLSQECIDDTNAILADGMYNSTIEEHQNSCETFAAWPDDIGRVIYTFDFRTCDTSALSAFCDANYQLIEYQDVKMNCEAMDGVLPYPLTVFYIDHIRCAAKSCPPAADWSLEDYIPSDFNASMCTVELLQEGEEPPSEPKMPAATLSQECTDEIDIAFDDARYKNISQGCGSETDYKFGNDTIFIRDYRECDVSVSAEMREFCDANYQSFEIPNIKLICNGIGTFYFWGIVDCVGTSCPSDPGDWLTNDVKYLFSVGACDAVFLEEGEEPPPPPIDPTIAPSAAPFPQIDSDDAPSAITPPPPIDPTDAPSAAPSAASGLWLPWTITMLPSVATTLAFFF